MTFTAQVGPDNAATLAAAGADGVVDFTELGGGIVEIADIDRLRSRPPTVDGHLTDDEDGLQVWIGGESYPVFDDFQWAVATAMGERDDYDLAKRAYDRAAARYGAAVAKVLSLAATPQAAATALGLDEAAVRDLAAMAPMSR